MSQTETLSWLVLGKSMNGASSSESSIVNQAALAIGLKGGDFLTKRLGNALDVEPSASRPAQARPVRPATPSRPPS